MRSLPELPGDIIQHIISFTSLTQKEAIQLSILSKDFFSAIRNRRNLVINHPAIITKGCVEEMKSLRNTLTRYNQENINLETFVFRVKYHESDLPSECIDLPSECIDLATKLSPKNLDIGLFGRTVNDEYTFVPQSIFGVESVVQMCLRDCVLTPKGLIQWPNLKRLRLESVENKLLERGDIDTGVVIENLIRSSPLLEVLEITNDMGLLEEFCVISEFSFQNLKILSLTNAWFLEILFINFDQKFPRLEELSIDFRFKGTINISSQSLKKLELLNIRDGLQEAHFHVPNIVCNGFGIIQGIPSGIRIEGNPDTETDTARPCKRSRRCFQMPDHFPNLQLDVHENSGTFTLKMLNTYTSTLKRIIKIKTFSFY